MYSPCHHDKFSVILVSDALLRHTSRLWRLFISATLTELLKSRLNIKKIYSGRYYSGSHPSFSDLFHPNSTGISGVNRLVHRLNTWPSGSTLVTAAEMQIALAVTVRSTIPALTGRTTMAWFARHLCTDLRMMTLIYRGYFSASLHDLKALK